MAAILNICHLLKTGDKIVCTKGYAGTRDLFEKLKKDYNWEVHYVDGTDLKEMEAAITPETKLVWLETPTNPTLKVIDIRACADLVQKHRHRHDHEVWLAVDNSLMSPYFQRPLSLGADICMSSAAKYINGHGDVLMGLVSVNNKELYERLKSLQSPLGAVPSPFDCFLVNRGLKTLHIRMKLHFQNGLAVAEFLEKHPRVEKVLYPGLPSHPQYELTKQQCVGVSGVMSFYIKGKKENAFAFLRNLKVFAVGFSLGGYESLAEHPATMTHASVPEDDRIAQGISDTLIRLSVGLEDEEDLLADLDQALEAAASTRTDERKRNSLSWTHREEQRQSHCSHKPCAQFPGPVSEPWADFGEGFHPSQLPADFGEGFHPSQLPADFGEGFHPSQLPADFGEGFHPSQLPADFGEGFHPSQLPADFGEGFHPSQLPADFGEGFHPSQLPAALCSILDQGRGSLDSKAGDATTGDCPANTCVEREVPQGVPGSCSCSFPDVWLVHLGLLWLFLGCAGLSLGPGCASLGALSCPAALHCPWRGRAPLVLPPFPEETGITRDPESPPVPPLPRQGHLPLSQAAPSVQPGLGHCQGSRGSHSSPGLGSLPFSQECLNLEDCAALLLFQVFVRAAAFSKG
ncbi:uncharacterized protein LOC134555346 [Prinia subflava]|uniref:uncharacterized protein LOC134555346 n=1 Tax=Prinia subflava TaxID=208062 RepID=UPI002FE22E93